MIRGDATQCDESRHDNTILLSQSTQQEQHVKVVRWLPIICLFISPLCASAANVKALHGTYSVQLVGVKVDYTGIPNPNCPQTCSQYNVANLVRLNGGVGTITFDGNGHFKFLSFITADGSGGPPIGVSFKYSVSGNTANATVQGSPVAISLGAYNSAGVAQVFNILVTDTGQSTSALMGTGVLQ